MSYFHSISAVPARHKVTQEEMKVFLQKRFEDTTPVRKFTALLRDNSIESKYSVLPDFAESCKNPILFSLPHKEPSTTERLAVFNLEALALAKNACEKSLQKANLKPNQVTHIITISCTGMSAPGLEIQLLEKLGLNPNIQRFAVNFMGCYAAFHGFRLADIICKTQPDAQVLLVSVELCSLHFRLDGSDDNLLSTYLFGDGAAACVISSQKPDDLPSLHALDFSSVLIPECANDMAWNVGNTGFEMVLSREVPKHIQNKIGDAFAQILSKNNLTQNDISGFAIHPGGKNILGSFEKGLGIDSTELQNSYDVLKNYGNMSSCTILFVLEKTLSKSPKGIFYSAAFGPGLSVESALWEVDGNL